MRFAKKCFILTCMFFFLFIIEGKATRASEDAAHFSSSVFVSVIRNIWTGVYEYGVQPVKNVWNKGKKVWNKIFHTTTSSKNYGEKYWKNVEEKFIEFGLDSKTETAKKLENKWMETFTSKCYDSILIPERILHLILDVSLHDFVIYMREAFNNLDTCIKDKFREFIKKGTKEHYEWCWYDLSDDIKRQILRNDTISKAPWIQKYKKEFEEKKEKQKNKKEEIVDKDKGEESTEGEAIDDMKNDVIEEENKKTIVKELSYKVIQTVSVEWLGLMFQDTKIKTKIEAPKNHKNIISTEQRDILNVLYAQIIKKLMEINNYKTIYGHKLELLRSSAIEFSKILNKMVKAGEMSDKLVQRFHIYVEADRLADIIYRSRVSVEEEEGDNISGKTKRIIVNLINELFNHLYQSEISKKSMNNQLKDFLDEEWKKCYENKTTELKLNLQKDWFLVQKKSFPTFLKVIKDYNKQNKIPTVVLNECYTFAMSDKAKDFLGDTSEMILIDDDDDNDKE